MPAAVPRLPLFHRLLRGRDFLREVRQCIELGENADHRLAAAVAGNKRGGHVRQSNAHVESTRSQLLDEQRRGTLLIQADFGELPNLVIDLLELSLTRGDVRQRGLMARTQRRVIAESGTRKYHADTQ